MMDVRYKRDLNSNYMILSDAGEQKETYESRMITENRIYGFLPCVEQKQEKQTEYFYEITGRQSMELLYERRKLSYEQLVRLLKDLLQTLHASEEYLLNSEHFVLLPEYLYLDTKTEHLCLCYYPGYHKEIRESFLELAEYLMGKLDKSDRKGIEFGYDLYQCALEKTGSWKNFFHKKKKPQSESYVAEADQIKSGSVLFLREQGNTGETTFLKDEKRQGLFLKSKNPDYPDLKVEGDSYIIGKRKQV